jgi:hypothetical protein
MGAALERRARTLDVSNRPRAWPAPATVVAGALGLLVGLAVFFSGGSSESPLVWIGGAAIVAAAAAVVAASIGALRAPSLTPLGLALVGFLAAFVLWQGLSVFWSIEADRSWNYFNRALVYLAFLLLGLFAGTTRRAPRYAAGWLAVLCAGAVCCALATKIFPGLSAQAERVARLSSPIGYWNALALLIDIGVPLALWLAAPRSRPHWLRALAVVFLYAAGVALLLTFSRGGLAVALVALALWFVIGRPRLESAGALAIALVPMLAVAGWAFSRPGLTKDAPGHSLQVHDGRWFALALVLGGLIAFGGAYGASVLEERWPATDALRRRMGEIAAVAGTIAIFVGIAGLVAAGITPSKVFHKFNEPVAAQAAQGPGRLGLVSSSSRWNWWKESWDAWRDHPVLGTGAGSFDITHRRLRVDDTFATEPHNLPLQFLTETGIVGFVLFLGIAFAGAPALVETMRRLEGEDRLAAAALAVGLFAYVVHGVVDFDWDFVAVTAPALGVLGVLLAAGRPTLVRLPVRRTLLSAATGAVAAAALYSLVSPWLALRKVDDAYGAIGRGDPAAAVSAAKTAHSLNPAAVDPLLVWAAAEHARGDDGEAGRLYTKAISIQPHNWRPWYYRARFLQSVDGPRAALFDAKQAAERDPRGGAGVYADQLQQQLGATSQ